MRTRRHLQAQAGTAVLAGLLFTLGAGAQTPVPEASARSNAFNDPFVQVTDALPGCPVPEGPLYTAQEVRVLEHERTQHGTSCHFSGRCRLANSYLYDAEIVPRVRLYLQRDGRFDDTSVWVLGQRRIVTLQGCVQSAAQAEAMEQAVRLVDDVMGVVNLLSVGTAREAVRYRVAPPQGR